MNQNPYTPPGVQTDDISSTDDIRLSALRGIRMALLILVFPALYNFYCFAVFLPGIVRTINALAILLTLMAIWIFGLSALEFFTGGIHTMVARRSASAQWKTALYEVLRRLPLFAGPGAILWAIWVFAFYQLRLDFHLVSIPIGIAGHALAACVYVPLIYRWYRVERFEPSHGSDDLPS